MSLQVWLPLNGNLENKGLSNVTITNNGATVDNNGKIGKCYSFGTNKRIACSQPENLSTTAASISCWVNLSSFGTSYDSIVNLSTGTGWNDTRLAIVRNNNTNKFGLVISNGSTYQFVVSTQDLVLNTWTHLTGVFDGNTLKFYINGVLNNTLNSTIKSIVYSNATLNIGSWSNANNFPINGKLNDVRIYNHALSPKEVKEISKGLCLHYKLSSIGGENLITSMDAGGRTVKVNDYTLNADFGQNLDTYGYFNVAPALELDKQYTLSFDVSNLPSGASWTWTLWNNSNYPVTINHNGHYSYTFVPQSSKLPSNYSLTRFLFDDGGRYNPANVVTFSKFKIEEGNQATPWVPHKTNTLAKIYNLNSSIEYDCSGLENHGTKFGDIISTNNTPRYNSSYKFNGTNTYINAGQNAKVTDAITVAWWGYMDNWTNYGRAISCTEGGGWNFEPNSGYMSFPVYIANSGYTNIKDTAALSTLKGWHHWAGTYDKNNVKFYRDGVLITTLTPSSKNAIGYHASNSIFIGAEAENRNTTPTSPYFNGNLSDVRIYATALSEHDIKDLYETSASIANNGVLFAREFVEE